MMKDDALYPLKFKPIFKQYLWGGRNLARLGKKLDVEGPVAESWEISDHGEDTSVVAEGPLQGKTLRDLIGMYGEKISPPREGGRFPILIKYIDAKKKLSIQVHPDDTYARAHEGPLELGKNECWFVMDAPPGAELIMGLKRGVSREDLSRMMDEDRIEDAINRIPVSPGDFIFIKTGTVHAILENIMVCEIQQNSDTTYRLYDWGRVGPDGIPRPLHRQKALDVISFLPPGEYDERMRGIVIPYDRGAENGTQELVRSRFFNIDLIRCTKTREFDLAGACFHTLNVIEGGGTIRSTRGDVSFSRGDSLLIPGALPSYSIETKNATLLRAFL